MAKVNITNAVKTHHISDVDVSYHPYVRFSHVAHKNVDGPKLFM